MPGNAASWAASAERSRRTSGSPPVRRTWRTPSAVKARTTWVISSNVSQCSGSSKPLKPCGRQGAAQIAAVSDGQTQIIDASTKRVN